MRLISSRFAKVAAVVLAAKQRPGSRVHGDALPIRPVPVFLVHCIAMARSFATVSGAKPAQGRACRARTGDESAERSTACWMFSPPSAADKKMLATVEVMARASGRAENVAQLAVLKHDGGVHGTERRRLRAQSAFGPSPSDQPNKLVGHASLAAKSSISSLSRKPSGPAVTREPKLSFQRGGNGHGISLAVHRRIVSGVVGLRAPPSGSRGAGGRNPCGLTSDALGDAARPGCCCATRPRSSSR